MADFKENVEKTKLIVTDQLLTKLEEEKLKLIHIKLEEKNISLTQEFKTVKELRKYAKKNLNELEYNKVKNIVNSIESQMNNTVKKLKNGSTNAFSKLINSDLGKTILKSLGISLSTRTALILAPTLATKIAVGTFIAGRGIYRIAKNNKKRKKINVENELNVILQDLELTRDTDGMLIDTRFSEDIQKFINDFLDSKYIDYNKTGYLAMREVIYNLDFNTKKELCNKLNIATNKGIDINERLEKAQKKIGILDIASNATLAASRGFAWGGGIATMINSVDPALLAGPLNGTAVGLWLQEKIDSSVISSLGGILSGVGTEVLENIPVIGEHFENYFAFENLVSLCATGTSAAVVGSLVVGAFQVGKGAIDSKNAQKEYNKLITADREKYKTENEKELQNVINNAQLTQTDVENLTFNLIYNYLIDIGIKFDSQPKSMIQLEKMIGNLKGNDAKKAKRCLEIVNNNIASDKNKFVEGIKQFGQATACAVLTGMSALSIYDLFKKGEFLPELSKEMFPKNNLYILQENQSQLGEIVSNEDNLTSDNVDQTKWISDRETASSNYQVLKDATTEETMKTVYENEVGDGVSIWNDGIRETNENMSAIAADSLDNLKENMSEAKELWDNGDYLESAGKFVKGLLMLEWDALKVAGAGAHGVTSTVFDVVGNQTDALKEAGSVGVKNLITEEKMIVPDVNAMRELLRECSDENLTDLYRFVLGAADVDHQSDNYEALMGVLNESEFLNRATDFIAKTNAAIDKQNATQQLITSISEKIAKYQLYLMGVLDLGNAKKTRNVDDFYKNDIKTK